MPSLDSDGMATVVYVKPRCPYCEAAREHLAAEGAAFEERDATANPVWKAELMGTRRDTGIVPTIVRAGARTSRWVPPGRG